MPTSLLFSKPARIVSVIFLFSALFILFFPHGEQPAPLAKEGPSHPGWQEDWLLIKKEEGKDIPENFTLEMFKKFHLNKSNYRTQESNLADIEELGPSDVAGRIRAFVVDHSNHDRYLAAGVSGGVWESLDRGETWTNLTPNDEFLNVISITQSPFDANIFYFSTGESAGNSAGISGVGLFKSVDGGQTFDIIPASMVSDFFSSWRIEHSQTDSNTLYIANRNGFFVTRDGGEFFDQLLFERCTDVEVLPNGEIYVGTDGVGIYYSPNGDDGTFVTIDQGIEADYGRVELATSANNPNVIAAALENEDDGTLLDIYYSEDRGTTWEVLNNPHPGLLNTSFTWYCHTLFVHPDDASFIIYGASDGGFSIDRGESWQQLFDIHADIHSATMDPSNSDQILMTSDGGVDRFERIQNYNFGNVGNLNNEINITQFYTGAIFPSGDIIGGTQDNGTWFMQGQNKEFDKVFGADGSFCAVNPLDSNQVYISTQRGNVYRTDDFFGNRDFDYISFDVVDSDDRTYFINPFQLNPLSPNQLFMPTQSRFWWSEDFGENWLPLTEEIDDPFNMEFIQRGDSVTAFICGGSAGLFRINNLATHTAGNEIDLSASAPNEITSAFMREIVMHPNGEELLVVFSSFSSASRVWKVSNIYSDNPTWESIAGDLPESLPANTIQVDDINGDVMAIGTDFGLFTTMNGGENWVLEDEIPQTVIYQIVLDESNTLHVFTHGRGVFKSKFKSFLSTDGADGNRIDFQLSPNPTADVINLSGIALNEVESINIFDAAGKLHSEFTQQTSNIDVSNLAVGAYFLQLRLKNGEQTTKQFIKK